MTCLPLSYAKDLRSSTHSLKLCCKETIHSSAEINSTETGESIHVAPAISWLMCLLLVVAAAGRWPVSFRSVKSHIDMLASISWYSFLNLTKHLTKHGNHCSLRFLEASLQLPLNTMSQATVLPFSHPSGH